MAAISSTTQLSVYSTIKSLLQTSSVLNTKFTSNDYYQFEPNAKSASFRGYPYIWINIPETETDLLVTDHSTNLKDFNIDIILRMEYEARDNYLTYANAIISTIESGESTLQSAGYYNVKIELIGTDDHQIIEQKQVIEGLFQLSVNGYLGR